MSSPNPASVRPKTAVLTARGARLLESAIAGLKQGRAMPDHEFLVEHDVTLDEAYTLAERLALGARMLLQADAEAAEGGLVGTVGMDRIVRAVMHEGVGP
jgi:hypothetical protein